MVPQSDSNGSPWLVGESVPHSQGMVSTGLLLPAYLLVHSYSPSFDVVTFGDLTISDDEGGTPVANRAYGVNGIESPVTLQALLC